MPTVFIYTDQWAKYAYGPYYPFKPIRLHLTYELMQAYGLLDSPVRTIPAVEAPTEDLLRFHTLEYLDVLQAASEGHTVPTVNCYGIGPGDNPLFPGLLLSSAMVVGASLQTAYYQTDKTLTSSLHESGNYLFPGTGFEHEIGVGTGRSYSVNVPLHPSTDDEILTWAFRQVVPPLLSAFHPDILVTQLGVDTFWSDPISHLDLTTEGFSTMVEAFRELSLPWVVLGGGGYDVPNVPQAWTLAWAIVNDHPLPANLPETHLESSLSAGYPNNSGQLLLDAPHRSSSKHRAPAWQEAERVAEYLRKHVFPLVKHTEWSPP